MAGFMRTAAAALLALTFALPASGQHIASVNDLRAVADSIERADAADRALVQRALEREDVQLMASRLGLDVADARSAVDALSGSELAAAAAYARDLDGSQVGGQTVTISLTVLLLVLILVAVIAS